MKNNRHISTGLEYFLKKAKSDPVAAYTAALILESEHRGPSAVQQYIHIAACGGYTPAMIRMACFLMSGNYLQYLDSGHPVFVMDKQKAVDWLEKAASAGDEIGHYLLARCCVDGICKNKSLPDARGHLAWVHLHPQFGNPYEPTEIMAFGAPSDEMRVLVRELIGNQASKWSNVI